MPPQAERRSDIIFKDFSQQSKRVLERSVELASDMGNKHIGTEHMLLAILDADNPNAAQDFLQELDVDVDELRDEVKAQSQRQKPSEIEGVTQGAKRTIELTVDEFTKDGYMQTEVTPIHLLRGLILERRGIAARTLKARGITPDSF